MKFTGHELNQEGGLGIYHAGARLYDPTIGRFMQQDPLTGMYPGWSPYNYVLGNPLIYVDPDGERPWREGEGWIDGYRAKDLTMTVIVDALKGRNAQLDFVNIPHLKDQTDFSYRTYPERGKELISFGKDIRLDDNTTRQELFVNTAYSFEEIIYGGHTTIGQSQGEDVVEIYFIVAEYDEYGYAVGQNVVWFRDTVSNLNQVLKEANRELVRHSKSVIIGDERVVYELK